MTDLAAALRPYAGQRVLVGVSGGADSVALLHALHAAGAQPVAAHLDHALRPDSAGDAHWVEALAARLGVPFETARVDVAAVAARRGWNLEDAARRLRYEFLTRTARKHGLSVILTAHTRRDQAETVLMQLLRGEAVLTGIPPVHGRVQRPWLDVPREALEAYLRGLNEPWLDDPMNADPHYTRVWLRQQVLPALRARFPAVEAALARLARLSREDDAALHAQAAALTTHMPLAAQPPAVLRRWVTAQLGREGLGYHTDHVQALAGALGAGGTRHVTLPGGQAATVTGGHLHLRPLALPGPDFPVPPGWTLRTPQPGDRIRLPGGTRKVSDVLTDRHVPRADRSRVPVLAAGQSVKWLGTPDPVWAEHAREEAGVSLTPEQAGMREALALAREAAGHGEVPVGAVVLDAAGQVIGRGRNTSREHGDMTRHAELHALREATRTAGAYLGACTLVVTLEPCPMCLGAALEARIGRIVYGARNPRAGALGGVTDLLAHHWGPRPAVQGGLLAREAARLLRATFQGFRAGPAGGAAQEDSGVPGAGRAAGPDS